MKIVKKYRWRDLRNNDWDYWFWKREKKNRWVRGKTTKFPVYVKDNYNDKTPPKIRVIVPLAKKMLDDFLDNNITPEWLTTISK